MALNRPVLWFLGLGCLTFLTAGVVVPRLLSGTKTAVLVNRSACDRQEWQEVGDRYSSLYQAHQSNRIRLSQVVIVSGLGEEVREQIPTPQQFRAIETFGEPDAERLSQIEAGFTDVEVLTCSAQG